jgi:hypothetical protein
MRRRRPALATSPHKERSVSLTEIVTLIAMVLVAGGVSSRLVELIKTAR